MVKQCLKIVLVIALVIISSPISIQQYKQFIPISVKQNTVATKQPQPFNNTVTTIKQYLVGTWYSAWYTSRKKDRERLIRSLGGCDICNQPTTITMTFYDDDTENETYNNTYMETYSIEWGLDTLSRFPRRNGRFDSEIYVVVNDKNHITLVSDCGMVVADLYRSQKLAWLNVEQTTNIIDASFKTYFCTG